jgi:hypothetical protein
MRAAAFSLVLLASGCLNLVSSPVPSCDEPDADPVTCIGLRHLDAAPETRPSDRPTDAADPATTDATALPADALPVIETPTPATPPVDAAVADAPMQPEVAPAIDTAPPIEVAPVVDMAPAAPHCPAPGFLSCSAGECVSRAHAFEGGSLEGAHVNAAVTSDFSKALRGPVEIRPFQGGHWLAADVRFTQDIAALSFIVPICPAASSAALRGKTFSAKLWVAGPPLSNGSLLSAATSIPIGFLIASRQNVALGVEIPVVGQFPDSDVSDKVVEVEIGVAVRNTAGLVPWDGTVYLDEIVVGD